MRYDLIGLTRLLICKSCTCTTMKRIDYYFVQNKIYQQPISTAAEPSKQSEVLIDACEHPVDKGNVITDR